MINNKQEIRAYYELNNDKPKAVAEKFHISYRTLMHWIKSEQWQRGKSKNVVQIEFLQDDMLKKELGTIKDLKARQIKQSLRENLSENVLDDIILNNLLDASTDKILLEVMNLDFVQKNIALSALIAKDELMRAVALRKENQPDFAIIAGAEKVSKMMNDLGLALFGKTAFEASKESLENDFEKMSENELLKLLANKS